MDGVGRAGVARYRCLGRTDAVLARVDGSALVVPGAVFARLFVLVANPLLRLYRVPAELLTQRGQHPRGVALLLAASEAGHQRQGDDRRRDVQVDRLLDRPAALAGVLDLAADVAQVLAVLLRTRGRAAPAATTG